MYELLKAYKGPADLKTMTLEELETLAEEIRQFLIQAVSKTGGHLASNLGVVELTIALHRIFDFKKDRLVFDVGHQSYVHKVLTGRIAGFKQLRKFHGMSGFPKTGESPYDHFNTGHASTSISAALGMARARDLQGQSHDVVCVIGDGAFSGGMVWEALNDIGYRKTPMIIILNDNEMSIAKNVGSMSMYLSKLRSGQGYETLKKKIHQTVNQLPLGKDIENSIHLVKESVKTMVVKPTGLIFENMGLKYLGPVDGHDLTKLTEILAAAKEVNGPVIIHTVTQKGRGYSYAMDNPGKFHGIAPFDCERGEICTQSANNYSKVFGKTMNHLATMDEKVVAITAAMPDGTGLGEFQKNFPDRFFDVGIAEEHAVTLASGMAISGLKPFVAIYSTFLQRALDQIIHDVALQNLPVVFCLDRAGIVGDDGETHQGEFDISFLSMIPGMTILAPKCMAELPMMLNYAKQVSGPVALRYPRGGDVAEVEPLSQLIPGQWEKLSGGEDVKVLLIGCGRMSGVLHRTEKELSREKDLAVYHLPFIKPLIADQIPSLDGVELILTAEDGIVSGGFGQNLAALLREKGYQGRIITLGYKDTFVEQGDVNLVYEDHGLSPEAIAERVRKEMAWED